MCTAGCSCRSLIVNLTSPPQQDPLADGAVIHGAATRALMKGTTLDAVIEMVRATSPQLKAPLVLFTYFNPILRKGLDKFCTQIKAAGASGALPGRLAAACSAAPGRLPEACKLASCSLSLYSHHAHIYGCAFTLCSPGLLVPDIPLEETVTVRAACEKAGIELVLLATPTTPKQRMADIARASQGFVYLVSVTGVTGVQEKVQARVEGLIEMLHSVTDKSIAVGFGVSKPEDAKQIVEWGGDGVICGSALVRALGEAASPQEGLDAMEKLAKSLRAAIPK